MLVSDATTATTALTGTPQLLNVQVSNNSTGP